MKPSGVISLNLLWLQIPFSKSNFKKTHRKICLSLPHSTIISSSKNPNQYWEQLNDLELFFFSRGFQVLFLAWSIFLNFLLRSLHPFIAKIKIFCPFLLFSNYFSFFRHFFFLIFSSWILFLSFLHFSLKKVWIISS